MTETHDCKRDGHCIHLATGELFQRHNKNAPGFVEIHCCWCGVTNSVEAYSKNTRPAKPPAFHVENHGAHI